MFCKLRFNWKVMKNKKHKDIFHIVDRLDQRMRQTIVNAEAKRQLGDLQNKKILIIDDDRSFTDFIVHSLKLSGHLDVISATDAGAGIKKVLDYKPDLIVLDIFMPKTDGLKLANAINALYEAPIPIIFVSANKSMEAEIIQLNLGDHIKFLPKPINKDSLDSYIKELLKS